MKRLTAFVLVLAFILSFSGCGDSENREVGSSQINHSTVSTSEQSEPTGESKESETTQASNETMLHTHEQNEPIIVTDSLVLVQSFDGLAKPYEIFLWSEYWSVDGWVSADGVDFLFLISGIDNEIPQITYCDHFEIYCRDGVKLRSISVYNSDLEPVHENAKQEV